MKATERKRGQRLLQVIKPSTTLARQAAAEVMAQLTGLHDFIDGADLDNTVADLLDDVEVDKLPKGVTQADVIAEAKEILRKEHNLNI